MAAEKLTKKRLIQLLIAMAILIGAFLYRTYCYQAPATTELSSTSESSRTN
ncbi:hypothetical protein SAMN05660772_00926 [Pasteurella testudinis DSM 23072]|uniref:Uncharacterized protein n=1 Tax=Pasteurella testudinis DSM 23072 TaxID=1122938 RepID=A0A1W1V0Y5_9PAST|nr:hypothetical protein [Pasteurella testudinis]SMB86671.1 hypothetical protein SAMN05660772_00926 [Pasteurella testudinis DSM 23072]SUB51845.1 Uncharacterised protein [Pasteurella testudinis]